MSKGKRSAEEIIEGVRLLIEQAKSTSEVLHVSTIARRIGCGRTTLYTNQEVRSLLLEAGIIEYPSEEKKATVEMETKKLGDVSLIEKRLRKAEERANRLEILLVEAQEKIKMLEAENKGLNLRIHLLYEGKSIL